MFLFIKVYVKSIFIHMVKLLVRRQYKALHPLLWACKCEDQLVQIELNCIQMAFLVNAIIVLFRKFNKRTIKRWGQQHCVPWLPKEQINLFAVVNVTPWLAHLPRLKKKKKEEKKRNRNSQILYLPPFPVSVLGGKILYKGGINCTCMDSCIT